MTNGIGARPYGSVANREKMRDYLLHRLEEIRVDTRRNGVDRISFSVRSHMGEVPKNFHGIEHKHVWESMGNIVCKVHARTSNAASLLVSAHYDTVFLSKGASDNTPSIASMLEMIYVLANDAPARHEVMFAFVNGEEFGLLGAADLSRYDAMFQSVAIFMNVDGTPGAKQLNLRTTGGFIDRAYSVVPRPLAFVVAGDIFGTGIVDSDTDWSVYSETLPGIDLVTFSHRQTYHSMKDVKIVDGFLQFQGDNMLALVRRIINLDTNSLNDIKSDRTPYVYFSILNSGYVVYTMRTNYTIFVMLIIAYLLIYMIIMVHRHLRWKDAAGTASGHPLFGLFVGALFSFASFLAPFCISALFGLAVSLFAPMVSYVSPAIIVFSFVPMSLCAIYAVQIVCRKFEKKWEQSLEINRTRLLWGTGLCWWFMLCFASGASKSAGSTYLLWFLAFFHLVAVVFHHVCYFFGLMSERLGDDMYEVMENAEDREDKLDEKEFDDTGRVRRKRPRNAIENERWKAAFYRPDIIWFWVFLISTWVPMLFFLDVMVPFVQMGATDLACWVMAPIIATITALLNLNFLPLSRRSHHYGLITTVLLVLAVITFIPLIISGAVSFTESAPYQVVPRQVGNTLSLVPEYPYAISGMKLAEILIPKAQWACGVGLSKNSDPYSRYYQCQTKNVVEPIKPTSTPILPPHGLAYAARINSSNAWVHTLRFPLGTDAVIINDVYTAVDPHNGTITFLSGSFASTESWTVEFNGLRSFFEVDSFFDDQAAVPILGPLIQRMPDWATFQGRGSYLATQSYLVNCRRT